MAEREPLSELLRRYRTSASLTIEALAERSGISDRTISNIERGASRSPQQHTLRALADALGLDEAQARGLFQSSAARRGRVIAPDDAVSIAPRPLQDFTGRAEEVARIVGHLDASPAGGVVVIVSGPPGIGKTTTAVEALQRARADDSLLLFVDLAGLATTPLSPLQVIQALLRQLPDPLEKPPRTLDEAAAAWKRASAVGRIHVLLDNAGDEAQVRPVLASSAHCAVVITSRRTLAGIDADRVALHPFTPGEGRELLGRIIPASQRNDDDVAELARLCGEVPLALRIAGNRVASRPGWTAADFVERMRQEEKRLRSLAAGDLGVATAFRSSYANLRPELRELYRSLPLIAGSTFDARMASAIIPGDLLDTEDMLDELTDLGLLELRGSTRYRLHDLARLYAAERLRDEETGAVIDGRRARLRQWLLLTAARAGRWFEPQELAPLPADDGLDFVSADAARDWLRSEAESWLAAYREAATGGEHVTVLLVADSLHWFSDLWSAWGHWHELFCTSASSAAVLGDALAEATHLGYVTWADIIEQGDFVAATEDAARAVDAADRSGDAAQRGWARFYLSWALDKRGDSAASIVEAEHSLRFLQEAGDREGILQAASLLGHQYHKLGSTQQAIDAHRALLDQVNASADAMPPNIVLFTRVSLERLLADEYLAAGRLEEAATLARSSLTSAQDIDYPTGGFISLLILARVLVASGDLSDAEKAFGDAEVIAETMRIAGAERWLGRAREALEAARSAG